MKITNNSGLPEPVVRAVSEDNYSRGPSNRSVTQLIDAPQARILQHEYDDQIEIDAQEMVWVVLGKACHAIFEKYGGGRYKAEERLFFEVMGWVISGAIDIQYIDENTNDVTLFDYKVTSVWSIVYGKEEWHNQLNFYAWLVRQCYPHLRVRGLRIVVVCRDWSKGAQRRGGADYPENPIQVVQIPLWDDQKQDAYVEERVRMHQDAEFARLTGDELPACTDEERWRSPTTYAVMKGKNKRAVRVYDALSDAEKHVADNPDLPLRVEIRESEAKRCSMGYCKAAPWCEQYQSELKHHHQETKDE